MILKWIMDALAAVFDAFLSLLSAITPPVPGFFASLPGYVSAISGYMTGTAVWVPWDLTLSVIGLWAVSVIAALSIRIVRMAVSLFTGGGGGAA